MSQKYNSALLAVTNKYILPHGTILEMLTTFCQRSLNLGTCRFFIIIYCYIRKHFLSEVIHHPWFQTLARAEMRKVVNVVIVISPDTVLNFANSWSKRPSFLRWFRHFAHFFLGVLMLFLLLLIFPRQKALSCSSLCFSHVWTRASQFPRPIFWVRRKTCLGTGILNQIIISSTFASPFYKSW